MGPSSRSGNNFASTRLHGAVSGGFGPSALHTGTYALGRTVSFLEPGDADLHATADRRWPDGASDKRAAAARDVLMFAVAFSRDASDRRLVANVRTAQAR